MSVTSIQTTEGWECSLQWWCKTCDRYIKVALTNSMQLHLKVKSDLQTSQSAVRNNNARSSEIHVIYIHCVPKKVTPKFKSL